jgi:hypothetical protein
MQFTMYDSLPEVQGVENLELLQLFQPILSKIAHQSKNCFVIGQNTKVTQILVQLANTRVALAAGVHQLNGFFVYGCFI